MKVGMMATVGRPVTTYGRRKTAWPFGHAAVNVNSIRVYLNMNYFYTLYCFFQINPVK